MAKYSVEYKCGCSWTQELYGNRESRENRMEYLGTVLCPGCKAKVEEERLLKDGYQMKVVKYAIYKKEYENNKDAVKGEYNKDDGTIKVYVKSTPSELEIKRNIIAGLTKSDIMKKAHLATKYLKKQYPEVNYQAQFSICLKEMYRMMKEINTTRKLTPAEQEKVGDYRKAIKQYKEMICFFKGELGNEIDMIGMSQLENYTQEEKEAEIADLEKRIAKTEKRLVEFTIK